MRPVPTPTWEGEPVGRLRDRWGVPELRVFERVGSTNDVAREMAEHGAAEGTVVLAGEQLAGRGRRGRPWTAPAGSSLLLSMVLRPRSLGGESVLPLRLGLAAAHAIEAVAGGRVGLKWPNDLVMDGRKVAGILCEGAVEADRPLHVIAGIGINRSQTDDDWPPDLAGTATSLAAATGRSVPALALAERLVAAWRAAAARHPGTLAPDEVREFDARDILRGRAVVVDGADAGVAAGVAADGALLVEQDGAARRIVSGTVRATDPSERGWR